MGSHLAYIVAREELTMVALQLSIVLISILIGIKMSYKGRSKFVRTYTKMS